MACGCNSKKLVAKTPDNLLKSSGNFSQDIEIVSVDGAQMVNVEYVGPIEEPFTINSRVQPGVRYRFANNQYHRVKTVLLPDAEFLTNMLDARGFPLYKIVASGAL